MIFEHDLISRIIAIVSAVCGAIALTLVCVGIGTPNWQTTYQYPEGLPVVASTNNFFYACSYYANGTVNQCVNRDSNLVNYDQAFTGIYTANNDTYTRLQNAAGLSIVGIIFLGLGVIGTLIMAIVSISVWLYLIPPILLFLACLFMLAGLAEGARSLVYNDYAVNLYETAQLLTILSFGISALAAGRLHFEHTHGSKY